MMLSRRPLVLGALAAAVAPAYAQTVRPLEKVVLGYPQTATDIGLYVADKRGYFREEGVQVEFINFDTAARMVTPFAAGDLHVVAGAASAAFYNAVSRGVDFRIVSDKVSTPPGRTSQTLIVRKDHVESGRYKSLADLKGMKVANAAPGTAAAVTFTKMLARAGLTIADVDQTFLAFPQHVIALQNGAVDAALPAEPSTTEAIRRGLAVKAITDDEAYPYHQIAVLFYGGKFIKEKPAAAKGFLKAFIRGVRDHNDALDAKGFFSGDKGEAIIKILNEYTPVKDPQFYRNFPLAYCNPDGAMHVESMKNDLDTLRAQGLVEGAVDLNKVIDLSFLNAVIAELGPYKKTQ